MPLHDMAGHLVRRLQQHSTHVFGQRTQEAGFDVTPVQFAALDAICGNSGSDQAFIAEMIGYDRATIGGVIDRLVKKGWVRRVVSEQDRRARELWLTVKGKNVRSSLQPIVENLQNDILAPLSESERGTLVKLIKKVVVDIDQN